MTRHRLSRRDMILAALAGSLAATEAAAQQSQGPGDNGIGGTGLPRRSGDGIGGTGIYGAISGFGSIIVNGVRVAYGADAAVWADGRRLPVAALRIGHVVRVEAIGALGQLRARRIELERVVVGPVGARRWLAREIEVLGQRVALPAGMDAPAEGTWVAVSGFRRNHRLITASLIEATDERVARVTGLPITSAQHEGLVIGDLPVSGAGLRAGRLARVSGQVAAGRLVARQVAAVAAAPPGRRVLMEGHWIRAGNRHIFEDTGFSAVVPDRIAATIPAGRRIVMLAEKDDSDRFVAQSVADTAGAGGVFSSPATPSAPAATPGAPGAPGGRGGPGVGGGPAGGRSGGPGPSAPGAAPGGPAGPGPGQQGAPR